MAPTGSRKRKVTEYGTQLQEKQKARIAYGLREKQFRRYFNQAAKDKAQTGNSLLTLLERRIDNVVFRAGLVQSRAQARQLISHRHFKLNGRRINVASILVTVGDVIEPVSAKDLNLRQDISQTSWLKTDKKTLKVTVESFPSAEELPLEFDTQKIVEFYSR
ncbi:hypothetical protein A3A71_02500 [Candidatus Berkelbacteria bacterium RIFCSPLOWO2_01_FULL_50_28]|uniref:Small ribosomal subunit protein uS4 n=1 Tax=Candidatus Berkelbacteria bacterium RIFCSPLOWO2_01_FULL_50_28 TaxID=1797471 RepID=A0A1F5EC12_9BACT|nr:MAG: hypothetical protein A2807_00895 [Candidatus Berkelbacteria bacterium RIFCSPHIGHO2_01_FULL_50_36]OGD62248.1 MAG: hypothetical protein A3F39_00915 [Candidatus Berkelbacteria bacterium RIFCSPHIGHO2_12_FULL_50_11]OGD64891.1 MAG: hypothetical protein A3A71_02500 [Candidatus Berkelbacteria bacterium RIFCSPLOWO2_01_FULL_50_28]